jgi:hypothetical protein
MLSAILLLSLAACGSDNAADAITGNNPSGLGSGPMSATIDGKAWASTGPAAVTYRNNFLSVAGTDATITTISVTFGATGPGTYSLAPSNSAGGVGLVLKSGATSVWGTTLAGSSGSVTLSTLTANHIVGTFAFDAVPTNGGATGTVHVTNGKFDITF